MCAAPGPLMIDTLVDEPIECITPPGIKTAKQEHEFDILIYATGFDGVTGAYDRIDIRGENGLRLKDAWAETPRTYLGMLAEGFPNMLMVLGPHTARGNSTTTRMWRLGPKKWTSGRGS